MSNEELKKMLELAKSDAVLAEMLLFTASEGYGIPPELTYFPQRVKDYAAGYRAALTQLRVEIAHIMKGRISNDRQK